MKSLWFQCPSASCNEFTSTSNNRDNKRAERAVGDGGENGERERVEEEGKCVKEKGTGEKEAGRDCLLIGWKRVRWIGTLTRM